MNSPLGTPVVLVPILSTLATLPDNIVGVTMADDGSVYATTQRNSDTNGPGAVTSVVYRVSPDGTAIVPVMGNNIGAAWALTNYAVEVPALSVTLNGARAVAVNNSDGSFWVSDVFCECIRHVTRDGIVHAYATIVPGGNTENMAGEYNMGRPQGLAYHAPSGNLFGADYGGYVLCVFPNRTWVYYAGECVCGGGWRDMPSSWVNVYPYPF